MIVKPTPSLEEIQKAVQVIIGYGKGRIVEVRALNTPEGTWSGYYNNKALIQDVFDLSSRETTPNVYWTLQEINPALMVAGRENSIYGGVSETTSDASVLRYLWLPIDCDPIRDPKVSSTDDEKARTEEIAYDIRRFLEELGIVTVLADSGNGYHVLVRLDIANQNGTNHLVKRVLDALDARFSNKWVHIDTTVHNPSRILKIYGSVARKGQHTDERPWRMARLIDVPDNLVPLDEGRLKELLAAIEKDLPAEKINAANEPKTPVTATTTESGERVLIKHGYMYGPLIAEAGRLWNGGYDPEDIPDMLLKWAYANCEQPIDEAKVRQYAKGSNWKRGNPGAEWVYHGPLTGEATASNPILSLTNGDGFMTEKITPRRVLLRTITKKEPVFFQQSINQIFAWRGTGKTNLGLGFTRAFATAGSFLNFEVPQRSRVLYIEGEMPESQLQERWKAIVGKTDGWAWLVTIDKQPDHMIPSLASAIGRAKVEATLAELESGGNKVDVLMLDSISTLFNLKANDEEEWIAVQAWLISLRSRGYTIFFYHHSGKGGLSRSHSKSEDMLDVSIKLEAPDNREEGILHAILSFDKARSGLSEPPADIKMRRTHSSSCQCAGKSLIGCPGDGVEWVYSPVMDIKLARAFQMFDEGASLGDVAKEFKTSRSTVQRWKDKYDDKKAAEEAVETDAEM